MIKQITFLFFTIFFLSCSKNATDPASNGYFVSGTITNTKGPVVNAKVSIDETANWTEYTDDNGYFKIEGITEGEHSYEIKKTENDIFIETSGIIQVNEDQIINSIRLPIPVAMYEAIDVTLSKATILWNPTDAEDFREYKLFRHTNPGLDETTGDLIYVSTSKLDTSFNDSKLASGLTYYYRVYLMNDLGRIGGSNIINAKTQTGNLIPDGAFEIIGSIDDNWQSYSGDEKTFEYDDSIKVAGLYALHATNPQLPGEKYPEHMSMNLKKTITLVPGLFYQFSAWMKASGMAQGTTEWVLIGIKTLDNKGVAELIVSDAKATSEPVEIEWIYRSIIFSVQEKIEAECYFDSGFNDFWIDELMLIVLE